MLQYIIHRYIMCMCVNQLELSLIGFVLKTSAKIPHVKAEKPFRLNNSTATYFLENKQNVKQKFYLT